LPAKGKFFGRREGAVKRRAVGKRGGENIKRSARKRRGLIKKGETEHHQQKDRRPRSPKVGGKNSRWGKGGSSLKGGREIGKPARGGRKLKTSRGERAT